MRWSAASYDVSIALHTAPKGKCFDRINERNILQLPCTKTMKSKQYKCQFEQGITDELLSHIVQSLTEHRAKKNVLVYHIWD